MRKYHYSKKMKKQFRKEHKVLKAIGKGCLFFLGMVIMAIIVLYAYLYGEEDYQNELNREWGIEANCGEYYH